MPQIILGKVVGDSAYEVAVKNDFRGSETEWLASLKGQDGQNGKDGKDGTTSKIAVNGAQYADNGGVIVLPNYPSVYDSTVTFKQNGVNKGSITLNQTTNEIINLDNTTYGVATTYSDGLMSSTDKDKLNGISENANRTIVDSYLSNTSSNPVANSAVKNALDGKANSSHTHDTRYYQKSETYSRTEIDNKVGNIDFSTLATKQQIGNLNFRALSDSDYNSLSVKDPNTIYFIYEGRHIG